MSSPKISKSRYLKGLQCPRLLWWVVREPNATELVPDLNAKHRFAVGHEIGRRAQQAFSDGVMLEDTKNFLQWLKNTEEAIAAGKEILFEAAFSNDRAFAALDILRRGTNGWIVSEVKSTLSAKETHIDELSLQVWMLEQANMPVEHVEVIHINGDYRHNGNAPLLTHSNVTDDVRKRVPDVAAHVERLQHALSGEIPEQKIGKHCTSPYTCPFKDRCWPKFSLNHVRNLYKLETERLEVIEAAGITDMTAITDEIPLTRIQQRQIAAVKTNRVQVDPSLKREMQRIQYPIAYFDFETIGPAIPLWSGLKPYEACTVQYSCHIEQADGSITHHDWIIEDGSDPRRALAESMIAVLQNAKTIVAYNAPFEKKCIAHLAVGLPDLAPALLAINDKFIDLLIIIRNNVYHPNFNGSFSIKSVLPALLPELSYADLEIGEGQTATIRLEQIARGELSEEEKIVVVKALSEYCKLDTWAMVELRRKILELEKIT